MTDNFIDYIHECVRDRVTISSVGSKTEKAFVKVNENTMFAFDMDTGDNVKIHITVGGDIIIIKI